MAENESFTHELVAAFIHSPIWRAPIQTFIEANCATFDYDDAANDEDSNSLESGFEEKTKIFDQYQNLVDALIDGYGNDLGLDKNELKKVCQLPTSDDEPTPIVNESYEQLYAARDFQLFQEMMRRKNLILQLQALVSLQVRWGLINERDAGDDLVLSLLLQATSESTHRRDSIGSIPEPFSITDNTEPTEEKRRTPEKRDANNDDDDDDDVQMVTGPEQPPVPTQSSPPKQRRKPEPKKPVKEPYRLPDLKDSNKTKPDGEWYREVERRRREDEESRATNQPSKTSTPQTIGAIPEEVLREKLRELSIRSRPPENEKEKEEKLAREKFLKEQRDKIMKQKQNQLSEEMDKETRNARPGSAAHVARRLMGASSQTNDNQRNNPPATPLSNDELKKRQALAGLIKQKVVDKQ